MSDPTRVPEGWPIIDGEPFNPEVEWTGMLMSDPTRDPAAILDEVLRILRHYEHGGMVDAAEVSRSFRAALSATPAPLDAAWAAAEAAVREWGGELLVGNTNECRSCVGWWATASKRDPQNHYPVVVSSESGRPRGEHHDQTPAAALLALAERIAREYAKP